MCLNCPNKNFKSGQYQIIDQICFAEFLSLYYTYLKPSESTENECQPVVLNDKIIEMNHDESGFSKTIALMPVKEKLKCRKIRAALRYHQASPCKNVEKNAHHFLFAFHPFCQVEQLKSPPITGSYFAKL